MNLALRLGLGLLHTFTSHNPTCQWQWPQLGKYDMMLYILAGWSKPVYDRSTMQEHWHASVTLSGYSGMQLLHAVMTPQGFDISFCSYLEVH